MSADSSHQIGEVADRVDLSLRTVRYYEEVGLVDDERDRAVGRLATYATAASAKIDALRASLESAEQFLATLRVETSDHATTARPRR